MTAELRRHVKILALGVALHAVVRPAMAAGKDQDTDHRRQEEQSGQHADGDHFRSEDAFGLTFSHGETKSAFAKKMPAIMPASR
ncbi:MAG: hypothetical protein QM796_12755 [Chthoniobacteraceae bacterium]